jgi:hypothetical protein
MECRPAVDDDVPWLTDTFVAARRFYERLGCRHESTSRHHDHFVWPTAAFATLS